MEDPFLPHGLLGYDNPTVHASPPGIEFPPVYDDDTRVPLG